MTPFAGSLDANVILRLLLNDVPAQHTAAEKLMERPGGQYAVADTALIEVIFVLERNYGFSRPQITEAIKGFMSFPRINCNRPLFNQALVTFEAHSSLSFEDCCLATYADLNGATPLWTFDKKLASQTTVGQLVTKS